MLLGQGSGREQESYTCMAGPPPSPYAVRAAAPANCPEGWTGNACVLCATDAVCANSTGSSTATCAPAQSFANGTQVRATLRACAAGSPRRPWQAGQGNQLRLLEGKGSPRIFQLP